jgi:hypothetical protein
LAIALPTLTGSTDLQLLAAWTLGDVNFAAPTDVGLELPARAAR